MRNFSNTQDIDVLGVGNAIVDILVYSTDEFLKEHSLAKGSMTLITEEQAENLYKKVTPEIQIAGGSAANTLAGIAELGGKVNLIARIKEDSLGQVFKSDTCATGVAFGTPAIKSGPSTARCIVFVTPDAQRTMCTYLGASSYLNSSDLNISILKRAKVLYLEGYLFDSPQAKEAFFTAAQTCKSSGAKIALSLSDSFCVERHRKSLIELVENFIDILFANEDEITSLYESKSLRSAIEKVGRKCELALITCGEKGSKIIHEGTLIDISPYNLGEVIDTTGAGDLYASGFLHGYIKGYNFSECGKLGSICAGKIITQLGSRSTSSLKSLIKNL